MSIDGRATRRALNPEFDYFSLEAAEALGLAGVSRLPCSLKVVLENLVTEEKIEADARKILLDNAKAIKDSAADYRLLLGKVKEKLARDRGFIL